MASKKPLNATFEDPTEPRSSQTTWPWRLRSEARARAPGAGAIQEPRAPLASAPPIRSPLVAFRCLKPPWRPPKSPCDPLKSLKITLKSAYVSL